MDYVVSAGQVSNGLTLNTGDTLTVHSGGTANNTIGDGDATMFLEPGASVTGTDVVSGILSLTSAFNFSTLGGSPESYSATVESGAALVVAHGAAQDTTVKGGGFAYVYDEVGGGTVSSGGVLVVNSGGTALFVTVLGGGEEIVSSGVGFGTNLLGKLFVSSGGVTSFSMISSGGAEIVSSGGKAGNDKVSSGGLQIVSGVASSASVLSGGTQSVASGGIASNTSLGGGQPFVNAAQQFIASGGIASFTTTLSGGGLIELGGGTLISATINSGGQATGEGLGSATTVMSGGTFSLLGLGPPSSGGDAGAMSPGAAAASGAATAIATVLSGGLASFNQATASSTTVLSGGTLEADNGTDIGTVVSGGEESDSGETTSNATIMSGGTLIADSGTDIGTVLSGGLERDSGETTTSAMVMSGGTLAATSGTDIGTVLNGGLEQDFAETTSNATISSGGTLSPFSGATIGTVLSSGGVEFVNLATASNTTVSSGARLFVDGGGSDTGTVLIGGSEAVFSGGTADNPTVEAGGFLKFLSGSTIEGTLTFGDPSTVEFDAANVPNATITGWGFGDNADLVGIPFDPNETATVSGGVLTVMSSGSTVATFNVPGLADGTPFSVTQGVGNGTDVTDTVCFCRGTLILTERGEVPVEELAVGDNVRTLSGALKPIVWIGMGRDLVTRRNGLARPIIVRAGAIADDVPRRDLYLTHGHALYLDGVLIPVENLVNHHSILWDETARTVEYYHIELEDHEVVLAEGAPAETYYDAGNRVLFHNTRPGSRAGLATATFAPVLTGGDTVNAVWARLFARAGGRTETDTTDDPDLHLVVDGVRIEPAAVAGGTYAFALAAPLPNGMSLASRSGVPSLLGITAHDHRRLGIAIVYIELQQCGITTRIAHDAPPFRGGGCHPAEAGYSRTDGMLMLPACLFAHLEGAFTLTVHSERPGMRYPVSAAVPIAA